MKPPLSRTEWAVVLAAGLVVGTPVGLIGHTFGPVGYAAGMLVAAVIGFGVGYWGTAFIDRR